MSVGDARCYNGARADGAALSDLRPRPGRGLSHVRARRRPARGAARSACATCPMAASRSRPKARPRPWPGSRRRSGAGRRMPASKTSPSTTCRQPAARTPSPSRRPLHLREPPSWTSSSRRSATCPTSRSRASSSTTSPRCSATRPACARPSTRWSSPYAGAGIERVVGIESRGFILASAIADRLGAGFVPIRKPGKLPAATRPRVVCARVRHRLAGDPQRRHQPRAARADRGRRAGHRRDGAGRRPTSSRGWAARFTRVAFLIELTFLHGREKLGRRADLLGAAGTESSRRYAAVTRTTHERQNRWGTLCAPAGPWRTGFSAEGGSVTPPFDFPALRRWWPSPPPCSPHRWPPRPQPPRHSTTATTAPGSFRDGHRARQHQRSSTTIQFLFTVRHRPAASRRSSTPARRR